MEKYCNETWKNIVEYLSSDIYKGLSTQECIKRRKMYGDNKIYIPKGSKNFISFIKELFHIQFLVALLAGIGLVVIKQYLISGIILISFLINLILKIIYIYRKQKEVGYLESLNSTTAKVIRDGREQIVKSEELVRGDIVIFSKGSLISADLRVISAEDIKVDEKNITGENFLKDKFESKIDGSILSLVEMKNILFKGSLIREGTGLGIVIETGTSTQLGKLLTMLIYANNNKHTFGKKIEKKLGKTILILTLVAIVAYFLTGCSNVETLSLSLLAIQGIPFGIISIIYSRILKRDFKVQGISILNLSIFDLIREIEIIFIDKIGSITKEKMVVKKLYTNNEIFNEEEFEKIKDINLERLVDILLLCNNAIYNLEEDNGKGDLLELGYLSFAAKKRVYKSVLDARYRRIFEIPMDFDKRFLTTLNKSKKGCRANIKGNLDDVLEKCTHIMSNGIEKELTKEDIEKIKAMDFNFSLEGLTTQGVAYRSFSYTPSESENIETNLVFVGIVALENPLNEDASIVIKEIKNRNIVPILFTEDNKITAITLGKKVGIIKDGSEVVSGVELDSLNKEELIEVLQRVRIFSRVNPEIKAKIIALFTQDKYSLATAGETLGELPSLSLSKVGISKGKSPEVVKRVSDIYIKDNYLKGFLSIFDKAKDIFSRINLALGASISIIITEIILVNIISVMGVSFENQLLGIIFMNLGMCIPAILLLLECNNKISIEEGVLRVIVWGLLVISSIYLNILSNNILEIGMLGIYFIIFIIFKTNIKFITINRELIIMLIMIGIYLLITSVAVIVIPISISISQLIKCIILISIYVGFELFMKRWQV